MSNLNSTIGSYYQLSSQNSANNSSTNKAKTVDITSQLIDALNNTSSTNNNTSDAYLLNLSPAASNLLNNSTNSGTSSSNATFTLSATDKDKIKAILDKYKDAPYTQETFNKIQDDLKAAGLDTTTLSLKDKTTSFSATRVLLDALNGTSSSNNEQSSNTTNDQTTKSNNYIKGILSQWSSISTAYNKTTNTTA